MVAMGNGEFARCARMVGLIFCEPASCSVPFFVQPLMPIGRFVTASPKAPARLARCPLKVTPMQEGWGLRFFVNKATDG